MEKKKFIGILFGFIVTLIIGLVIGYFGHSKNLSCPENESSTPSQENNNSTSSSKTNNYSQEEIDAIGEYLWHNKLSDSFLILNGEEENINNLTDEDLITLTLSNMDYNEYRTDYPDYDVNFPEDYRYKVILNTDVIKNNFNNIFGKNLEFKDNMEFSESLSHDGTYYENCGYDKNMYLCDGIDGGGDSDTGYNYFYGSTSMDKEIVTLTVYGYKYTMDYANDSVQYTISSSKNNNIAKISDYIFEDAYELSKLENEHKNEMDVYKVTFKNNGNGNYYWYQTDALNK